MHINFIAEDQTLTAVLLSEVEQSMLRQSGTYAGSRLTEVPSWQLTITDNPTGLVGSLKVTNTQLAAIIALGIGAGEDGQLTEGCTAELYSIAEPVMAKLAAQVSVEQLGVSNPNFESTLNMLLRNFTNYDGPQVRISEVELRRQQNHLLRFIP